LGLTGLVVVVVVVVVVAQFPIFHCFTICGHIKIVRRLRMEATVESMASLLLMFQIQV
jgi:sulfite exporter TauE/SafE